MAHHILRYLRDCYQADHARTALRDLGHGDVLHHVVLPEGVDLYTGDMEAVPTADGRLLTAHEAAAGYRVERAWVHGLLVLAGYFAASEDPNDPDDDAPAKGRFLCAPVLVTTMDGKPDPDSSGVLWLEHLDDSRRINHGLLGALPLDGDADRLAAALWQVLGQEHLTAASVAAAGDLIADVLPEVDTTPLLAFPQCLDESDFRRTVSRLKRNKSAALLPVSTTALIKRGAEARGVLAELHAMAERDDQAAPVAALFQADPAPTPTHSPAPNPPDHGHLPTLLSAAQTRVLTNAAVYPLSMVIGPPGTGKSYTIAALALDQMLRGGRVLVVSKMDHAVDVAADKLHDLVPHNSGSVRGGRRRYSTELKDALEQLTRTESAGHRPSDLLKMEIRFAALRDTLDAAEAQWRQAVADELRWGEELVRPTTTWRARLRRLKAFRLLRRMRERCAVESEHQQWHRLTDNRLAEAAVMAPILLKNRLTDLVRRHRREFRALLKALRARTGTRRADTFAKINLQVIMDAFPVWLVNMAHLSDVLPFEKELFDLVVIDEASQCDMAGCLPALHRAKRAVFVGDPCQLRHISFVSRARRRHFAEKYDLNAGEQEMFNYREMSILDLVNDHLPHGDRVVFLNEYYRGKPPLIAFSNKRFYNGDLQVMTALPDQDDRNALVLVPCPGTRDETGVNMAEIERVVADIKTLLLPYLHTPEKPLPTVGVLSPFRVQVDALAAELTRELPLPLRVGSRLHVATAHGFQGEERDHMYLSLALDDRFHTASLRFLEHEGVFNVSITRARRTQRVYCSIDPARLPGDGLLAAYLASLPRIDTEETPARAPEQHLPATPFAEAVGEALRAAGYGVRYAQVYLGMQIALTAKGADCLLLIDLVGDPHTDRPPATPMQHLIARRAGRYLHPLTYSHWNLRQASALAGLIQHLGAPPAPTGAALTETATGASSSSPTYAG